MPVFASVVAALLELGGVGILGYAWFRSAASGHEIYASAIQSGTGPLRTFELQLEPGMNPLSVYLRSRVDNFHRTPMAHKYHYQLSVLLERKPVFEKSIVLEVEAEELSKSKISQRQLYAGDSTGAFEVPAAGTYQFAVAAPSDVRKMLYNMDITVKRNVSTFDLKKLWWGIGLIVAGGLIQLLFGAPLPGSRKD